MGLESHDDDYTTCPIGGGGDTKHGWNRISRSGPDDYDDDDYKTCPINSVSKMGLDVYDDDDYTT
eukprot:2570660-Karenia_brevis.AAC.1